jgi:hypothetical protein
MIPIRVGDKLYGFCGGYFGRDSYADKVVEAVGADWIVARDENDVVVFASFDTRGILDQQLDPYRTEELIEP